MLSREDTHAFRFVLERLDHSVIIIDRTLTIRFANRAAERLLRTGDGVARFRTRLAVACPRARRGIRHLARGSQDPDTGTLAFEVVRARTDAPLILCARRAEPAETADGRVVITVHEPADDAEPIALRLRRLGLTPGEARVAARAVLGRSVPGIAADLGVSANTVKTHLRATYRKLGIASRAALARLAAQI